MTSVLISAIAPTTPIASTVQPVSEVEEVVQFLAQLGLPALPVAPAQNPYLDGQHKIGRKAGKDNYCPLSKELQPEPLFTGKNPSFLKNDGKPKLVKHQNYQNRLPCEQEIQSWWKNPTNGIGALGGWGNIIWLDFDVKQFSDQDECDQTFYGLLETHPELAASWIEQTHSGGYRLAVKPQTQPNFTNFALEPGGKHRGEALGKGRFTVLAPTIGASGNPYRCLNRAVPVEIESLESIGVYPVAKQAAKVSTPRPQRPTPIAWAIPLEKLANKTALAILNGDNVRPDRSDSLATACFEWFGWERWAADHGVPVSNTTESLAYQAGEALGLDDDRIKRILDSIDPDQHLPSAQYRGSDEACWRRVAKLDRSTFEALAPQSVQQQLQASYARQAIGGGLPPGGNGGDGGDGNGGSGGNSGDSDDGEDKNPDAPLKEICEELGLDFRYCCTNQSFDGNCYRELFGGGKGDWIVLSSGFYRWNGKYWQIHEEGAINTMIADYCGKAYKIHITKKGIYFSRPYENNRAKESAFRYCRSRLERKLNITNAHLLGFSDCVVDLRSGQTMPHERSQYLTSIIPLDYQAGSECPDIFRDFVIDSFGEEQLEVIRAFTSAFLDPTAPYGRFPHLLGKSGGGKGTLGRFWSNLFGEIGSGSSSQFSDLSTPEGRHQYLSGKRIFAFPDTGGFSQGLRAFYELVDNGMMSGRALFNPVAYSKQWNVRFWVASVDHLQIENAGDGWARRAYLIPVRAREVDPDPTLSSRLDSVKAAVISWALAMPREERDRILKSPPTSERARSLSHDAALYGDSTRAFVDACLRPYQPTASQPKLQVCNSDLHSWYVAYCREHGYTPMGQSKFISHLKTVLPYNHVDRGWSEQVNGQRHRIPAHWDGIDRLPGVFHTVGASDSGDAIHPTNPVWICIKRSCVEGGLEAFEAARKPPKPAPNAGVQGVQGQEPPKTALDTLKPAPSTGVQGGSTVHRISVEVENFSSVPPLPDSSIETQIDSNVSACPVQPGHPGHPDGERVSAIQPTLDTPALTLDTLDTSDPAQAFTPAESAQVEECCQQLEVCLVVKDYKEVLGQFGADLVDVATDRLSERSKLTILRFKNFLLNQRPF